MIKARQVYAIIQQTPEGSVDLSALLHAKRLENCRITTLAVNADRALRHAIAAGCDQAVLLEIPERSTAFQRAAALESYLQEHPFDLILTSAFQADEEAMMTGVILFERLGLSAIHQADRIERDSEEGDEFLKVRKTAPKEVVTSRVGFPAGISVGWTKNPEVIPVGRLLEAYQMPVETVRAECGSVPDFKSIGLIPMKRRPFRAPEKVSPEEAANTILHAVREVRR